MASNPQNDDEAQPSSLTPTAALAETDDETLAIRKRRRVSFADVEITSVHIFNRDEDYDTPPDAQPKSTPSSSPAPNEAAEVFSFLKDFADKEVVLNEEDDDGEDEGFLRPGVGSPSPGSSGARSANSNDEEDFFGPVSASFIRPRRVSDSAASDENHDITMDSTAFSMHFRSLARSESGCDLKTPTGISVGSEDKTPVNNASEEPGSGSSMVMTRAKNLLFAESVADDKSSVGRYSGDMSLVGDDSQRYDYGKLSPTLDALLAEGRKDVFPASFLNPSSSKSLAEPEVSACAKNTSDVQDLKVPGDTEMGNIVNQNTSVNTFSEAGLKLRDADGDLDLIQTPNQITKTNESSSYSLKYGNATSKSPPGDNPSGNLRVSADEDSIPSKPLNLESPYRSPLVASMSSTYAKPLQIFDDTANSLGHPISRTPSPKLPGPHLSSMSEKHGGSMSSILKGISELKSIRSSPYASLLADGSERSRNRSSPLKDDVVDNKKKSFSNHASIPVVCLEDKLWNFDSSNRNHCGAPTNSMDAKRTDTPNKSNSMESLNQKEGLRNLANAVDALQNMHVDQIRKDNPTELATMISSPRLRMLAEEAEEVLLPISAVENQGFTEFEAESPSMDRKPEIRTGGYDKYVGTPAERLHHKIPSSTGHQESLLGEKRVLNQADENTKVANKRCQTPDRVAHMIAPVSKRGNIKQSSPPPSYSKNSTEMTGVADKVDKPYFLRDESNNVETLQTPLRSVTALNFRFGSSDRNLRSGTGPSKSVEELEERLKFLPGGSVSSYINKRCSIGQSVRESSYREEQAIGLNREESRLRPTIQESQHALQSDKMQHHLGNFRNQNSKHAIIDCQQATPVIQSPIRVTNIKNSAHKKSEEVHIEEREYAGKYASTESTSEVNGSGGSGLKFIQEQSNKNDNERVEIRAEAISMLFPDILSKVAESTEQFLSPIVDKLDVKSIDMLEDTLDHLQRGKEYEMCCSGFQSQKAFDGFNILRHKRTAEAKLMFHKIIYENAKVQLLRAKRERMQKNVQKLSSAIQECQSLKLKLGSENQGSAKSNLAVDSDSHPEQSSSEGQHAEDFEILTLTRQNIGGLKHDLKNLTKSFQKYLKMDGECNSEDTLAVASEHLKKRMGHKLLRQKLQLWEVDGFEVRNGHESIVLNYHGFFSRRFTITSGPTPSLCISDKLNDAKMRKNFPNMDACTAFSFVMNSENFAKYFGSRRLMEAAQITSSVLQNLLDVLGELQLAHLQVRGLCQASFHSPSDQQLNLQLCFIDFTRGRQLTMTLDVTCLNRGIYPSEAVPYQIHERPTEIEEPAPSLLSAELRAAFQSLEAGFSRILMMCRCVSQVLQSSS